ncbi:hypothetical protein MycrhDRAFT_1966 [Mycolicibacterium rhodesiae JS60]|nr:hypothetical protein MycrhDRAFT_1966 [Mycolicibacterium rhodesiae JS60]
MTAVEDITTAVTDLLDAGQTTSGAGAAVPLILAMAKAYTRGRGFTDAGEPNDEIAAVITTAAARLAGNARQINWSMTMDTDSSELRSAFTGWTLAEQFVLNRYRVRAR